MTAQAGGASPDSRHAALNRSELRRQLRHMRRAIPADQQQRAAVAVARTLARMALIQPGARIGVYLSLPGELNLQPFIELAWSRRCHLFVPHITSRRRRQMAFYRFTPDSRLRTHEWGMPQLCDIQQPAIAGAMLDAVLVPVLGFDAHGHRLGMGAGFYDRHFARLTRTRHQRPHLIGVGYACQQLAALVPQPHDITLEWMVTEAGLRRASTA